MMHSSWNLKPFQRAVLNIFREFERICEKHNLKYYAIGGTLLGAIRHQGFIPWDDDFDVAMPREDFNKFVSLVKDELPAHLKFSRGGDERHSPIYFSKIIDESEGVVSRMSRETGLDFDFAPFVDVFVLDGVPANVLEFRKWWRGRRLIRLCQVYRYPQSLTASNIRSNLKRCFLRTVGFFVSLFYPRTDGNEAMMRILDSFSMRWPYETSKMVTEVAFMKLRTDRVFDREIFGDARIVPFEDGTIRVPMHAEEYLTRFYGDYMTPPPPECQIPEHAMHRAYNHV